MKETNKDLVNISTWQILFMASVIIVAFIVLVNAPKIIDWSQKVNAYKEDIKVAKWSVQSVYERDSVFMQNRTNISNVIANRCQIYVSDYVEACQQTLEKEFLK